MSDEQNLPVSAGKMIEGTRFVRSREVARWLGVTPLTICKWARAGKLVAYRLNPKLIVFDPRDIQKFLNDSRLQ